MSLPGYAMNHSVKNMTTAGLMLALGLLLPFLTGQIPAIGSQLCPMHLPVLLCGFLCGWKYGLGVGFLLPLLRSALFGMPVMYPAALAMAFELGTYGLVSGWLWQVSKYQCVKALYRCLIAAMLAGRIVWGLVEVVLLGLGNFGWQMFLGTAFVTTLPGIVLQLILVPMAMVALHRAGVVHFRQQAV